jgi:hypothetical protein
MVLASSPNTPSPLRAAQRRRASVGAAFGIAFFAAALIAALSFAAPSFAQARKSYNFLDLPWGADMAAARAKLEKAGFKVARNPVEGHQEEFVVIGLQASIASVDRGKRLVATGKIAGQPVQIDLAFDKDERLNHVIITSKYWDGTIPGARTIVDLATRIVMFYEERYGPAIKRKEDGWVDTALWPRAGDGSLLAVYVRGTEGFMFSPSYKTALRVDFVGGKVAETSRIEMPPESQKEPPKPKPLTKEELRKEYQKDPSEFMPPPPGRR